MLMQRLFRELLFFFVVVVVVLTTETQTFETEPYCNADSIF